MKPEQPETPLNAPPEEGDAKASRVMAKEDLGYDIFISYSRRDEVFAEKLERTLKKYTPPIGLRVSRRRLRVFLDKSEARGNRLSAEISEKVSASRKLIVLCSPAACSSKWVDLEIRQFAAAKGSVKKGSVNIIPLLVNGLPNEEAERLDRRAEAAFPSALISVLSDIPWAPDFRQVEEKPIAISAVRTAWFHLLSQIYDVSREEIEQRERQRRFRQLLVASTVGLVILASAYLFSSQQAVKDSVTLADQSRQYLEKRDRKNSLQAAISAIDRARTPQAETALKSAVEEAVRPPLVQPSVIAVDQAGSKIAIASPFGTAILLDVKTGIRHTLCDHVYPYTSLLFSPDGTLLVSYCEEDGTLSVWNTATRLCVGKDTLAARPRTESKMWISPDSRNLVLSSFDRPFQLRRLPSAQLVRELSETWGHDQIVFAPSGKVFATFNSSVESGSRALALVEADNGKVLWLPDEKNAFDYVAFSKDSTWFVALKEGDLMGSPPYFGKADLSSDFALTNWRKIPIEMFDFGLLAKTDSGPPGEIALRSTLGEKIRKKNPRLATTSFRATWINRDGTFAVGSQDKRSDVYILPSLEQSFELDGQVDKVSFSPDGDTLCVLSTVEQKGSSENRSSAWSLRARKCLWSAKGYPLEEFSFSRDSKRLFRWYQDLDSTHSLVQVCNPLSGQKIWDFACPQPGMTSSSAPTSDIFNVLFIDSTGSSIVSRSEHTAFVWDIDHKQLQSLNTFEEDRRQLAADEKALSGVANIAVMRKIAERRLNLCSQSSP